MTGDYESVQIAQSFVFPYRVLLFTFALALALAEVDSFFMLLPNLKRLRLRKPFVLSTRSLPVQNIAQMSS